VSQLAQALAVTPHWIYDRINNGRIEIAKDPGTRLYLFPDDASTLKQLKALKTGKRKTVRLSKRYQHA
jgi:hypothetical protein